MLGVPVQGYTRVRAAGVCDTDSLAVFKVELDDLAGAGLQLYTQLLFRGIKNLRDAFQHAHLGPEPTIAECPGHDTSSCAFVRASISLQWK